MPIEAPYQPALGSMYAQSYALSDNLPENQRLFYYDRGEDCTNYISQCVWAAYGGWIPGFTPVIVQKNEERILQDYRQVGGVWYGSRRNIGSNRWCRVEEFFTFVTDHKKTLGPRAAVIAEGGWNEVNPAGILTGDVIQMIVMDYKPNRYGHSLFVTREGQSWDDLLICCHTDDRLNEPMGWFAQFPQVYSRIRVLRFESGMFEV